MPPVRIRKVETPSQPHIVEMYNDEIIERYNDEIMPADEDQSVAMPNEKTEEVLPVDLQAKLDALQEEVRTKLALETEQREKEVQAIVEIQKALVQKTTRKRVTQKKIPEAEAAEKKAHARERKTTSASATDNNSVWVEVQYKIDNQRTVSFGAKRALQINETLESGQASLYKQVVESLVSLVKG